MELELKKNCFEAFEVGTELIVTQEESAETIVPDYCPDIARIIDTEGKIFLHSRELHDGKAEVSGTVRVTVLYTPDGESGIRTLEFAMPFSALSDGKAWEDCVCLSVQTEAEFLETRVLNPRKVFTHCKLVSRFTGYRRAPLTICSDVESDAALCVEKKQETQHTTLITQIAEKDFTFSDEMSISPGKDGAVEILTSRVSAQVTETKIIGNKLIVKGIFPVNVLYRTADGACCSSGGELPFSQILEVEGASENAQVSVQLQFTGTDFQVGSAADREGRQITVTLYLHAFSILRQEQTVTLLNDLYSTAYELGYEAEPVSLIHDHDVVVRRQTVREVLEIGVVADSVLDANVCCGSVSVTREGESFVLRTGASIRVLYLDEGGVPLMAERCVDVSCQMEAGEDCRVSAKAACPDEVQASIGERGIEVRFPVEFQAQVSSRKKCVSISSVRLLSETPRDMSGLPSLVLRSLSGQETLWMLAKRFHTTVPSILAANGWTEETEVPRDQMLLIPKKRI